MAEIITIREAVAHFLNSIGPEQARDEQPEVERLVAVLGEDRDASTVTAEEVARYFQAERDATPDEEELARLEPVRAFLAYCARLSFIDDSVLPRPAGAAAAAPSGPLRGVSGNDITADTAYFVTIEGLANLERELEELKAERPVIADALRAAMADKDFRENAPLDAARDAQAHLEARIRQIEDQLRHAVIMDAESKGGRANVGSTVRVLNLKADREQTFHLVSPNEVDPASGKISIESPMGQAVINKGAGDEVTVHAPAGEVELRVLEVIG